MKQSSGKPESMDASKKPRSDGLPSARRAKSQLSPPPSSNTPIFEDEQAILTVSSSFKPIFEDEQVLAGQIPTVEVAPFVGRVNN